MSDSAGASVTMPVGEPEPAEAITSGKIDTRATSAINTEATEGEDFASTDNQVIGFVPVNAAAVAELHETGSEEVRRSVKHLSSTHLWLFCLERYYPFVGDGLNSRPP